MQACKEVLSWGYFSSYAALMLQEALLDQQLMVAWGGWIVQPGTCGPTAGDLPVDTLNHQQRTDKGFLSRGQLLQARQQPKQ